MTQMAAAASPTTPPPPSAAAVAETVSSAPAPINAVVQKTKPQPGLCVRTMGDRKYQWVELSKPLMDRYMQARAAIKAQVPDLESLALNLTGKEISWKDAKTGQVINVRREGDRIIKKVDDKLEEVTDKDDKAKFEKVADALDDLSKDYRKSKELKGVFLTSPLRKSTCPLNRDGKNAPLDPRSSLLKTRLQQCTVQDFRERWNKFTSSLKDKYKGSDDSGYLPVDQAKIHLAEKKKALQVLDDQVKAKTAAFQAAEVRFAQLEKDGAEAAHLQANLKEELSVLSQQHKEQSAALEKEKNELGKILGDQALADQALTVQEGVIAALEQERQSLKDSIPRQEYIDELEKQDQVAEAELQRDSVALAEKINAENMDVELDLVRIEHQLGNLENSGRKDPDSTQRLQELQRAKHVRQQGYEAERRVLESRRFSNQTFRERMIQTKLEKIEKERELDLLMARIDLQNQQVGEQRADWEVVQGQYDNRKLMWEEENRKVSSLSQAITEKTEELKQIQTTHMQQKELLRAEGPNLDQIIEDFDKLQEKQRIAKQECNAEEVKASTLVDTLSYTAEEKIQKVEDMRGRWIRKLQEIIAKVETEQKSAKKERSRVLAKRLLQLQDFKRQLERAKMDAVYAAISFGVLHGLDQNSTKEDREKCVKDIAAFMKEELKREFPGGAFSKLGRFIGHPLSSYPSKDEIEVIAAESADLILFDRMEAHDKVFKDRHIHPQLRDRRLKGASVEELLVDVALRGNFLISDQDLQMRGLGYDKINNMSVS